MKSHIFTIEEKCTGCNKCIAACPVDCANQVYRAYDGSRKVFVDSEYCIACGACLRVCDHQARDYLDDTEEFFEALSSDEEIHVVAAPAAQLHFEELPRLFGWLKSLGVGRCYDVSLGADIATWAYLRAMKERQIPSMIAQPCPSIVNYCERYCPELLEDLAPVQSPLLCLAIYLRRHEGVKGKLAFLSPCIAKSEEIRDANTGGLVQYNVTFAKLQQRMEEEGIDLLQYPALEFDGMPSGIGHVYSRPGGLGETVRVTDKSIWLRQVDSVKLSYPYLCEYLERRKEGKPVPGLVDILNCTGGCNFGTGTRRAVAQDDIDQKTDARKREKEAVQITQAGERVIYAIQEYFDKELCWEDFKRSYSNHKVFFGQFCEENLEDAYRLLYKDTPESRNINCHACGYGSCKKFAQALKWGMNVAESCIDYERNQLKRDWLTSLLNHGGLDEALELSLRRYRMEPYPLSLILMDVDDFKQVNDRFGHDSGDRALKEVAAVISRHMRPGDAAGRWGGDEFMIILPHMGREEAASLAKSIQREILASGVLPGGACFSSSAGVAEAKLGDMTTTFFKRADQALYEAKKFKDKREH